MFNRKLPAAHGDSLQNGGTIRASGERASRCSRRSVVATVPSRRLQFENTRGGESARERDDRRKDTLAERVGSRSWILRIVAGAAARRDAGQRVHARTCSLLMVTPELPRTISVMIWADAVTRAAVSEF